MYMYISKIKNSDRNSLNKIKYIFINREMTRK